LILQDIQTNDASRIDVGVVNLCGECNGRALERVINRKENLQFEDTSGVRRIRRTKDNTLPSKEVISLWAGRAVGRRVILKVSKFASDTTKGRHLDSCMGLYFNREHLINFSPWM
jgi:hypothetical protein